MTLRSSHASKEKWPHDFVVVYEVMLGAGNHLKTSMKVANTGVEPMTFTTALHTYFRCTDATAAKVTGLKGASYLDSLNERVRREEANEFVSFNEEVDRIYLSTTDTLAVDDVAGSRSVRITKKNLPDAVVWNPWIEKSKATGDLGDEVRLFFNSRIGNLLTSCFVYRIINLCASRLRRLNARWCCPRVRRGSASRCWRA